MKVKIVALILLTFFLSCSKEKTEIKIPDKLIGLWTYYKGFTGYGIKIDKNGSYTHNYYSLKFLKFEGFDAKIIKATDDEIHFKIKDKTYIHKYRIEEGRLYVANSPAELLKVIKNREQEYTKLTAQPSVSLNLEGLYGTYSSANEESLNTVFITIAKNGDFRVSLHYKQSNKIAKVSGKVIGFKRIKMDVMLGVSIIPIYFAQSQEGKHLIFGYSESDYLEAVDIYKRDSALFVRGCHFFMKIN